VTLAFPNSTGRMEFAPGPALRGPLVAVVRYSQDETHLRSDVEMRTADGRVVLRYMERVEEIVHFPAGPYLYWVDPRRVTCSREITALFAGVPGIGQCTVTEVERAGDKLLVNRHWSKVLARMILSRSERADFERAILPPVPAAGWLLGRVAAKDAVRLQGRLDVCMADVILRSDAQGKPLVSVQGEAAPSISLSHTGFLAVAAATSRPAGVGIDVEPLRPLDPVVVEDAFHPAERELLEALSAPHSYAAAWTAKEAIGKALGRGVLGGPRSIRLIACERAGEGFAFAAVLEGAMAEAFPEHAQAGSEPGGKGGPLAAHARISSQHMVALCIPG
jgi:phosphopantetheinyl transferase